MFVRDACSMTHSNSPDTIARLADARPPAILPQMDWALSRWAGFVGPMPTGSNGIEGPGRFIPPLAAGGNTPVAPEPVQCGAPVYTAVLPDPPLPPPPVVQVEDSKPLCRRTTGDMCRDLTSGLALQSEVTAAQLWDCAQRGFRGAASMDVQTLRAIRAGLKHPLQGGARCPEGMAGLSGGQLGLGLVAAIAGAAWLAHQAQRRRRAGRMIARVRGDR